MPLIDHIHLVAFYWNDKSTLAVLFHFSRNEVLQVLFHHDLGRVALITPKLELLAVGRRCLRKPRSCLLVVEILESAHVFLVCLGYGVIAILRSRLLVLPDEYFLLLKLLVDFCLTIAFLARRVYLDDVAGFPSDLVSLIPFAALHMH